MDEFTIKRSAEFAGDIPVDAIARLRAELMDRLSGGIVVVAGVGEEVAVQVPALTSAESADVRVLSKQTARALELVTESCAATDLVFGWFVIDPPPEWEG